MNKIVAGLDLLAKLGQQQDCSQERLNRVQKAFGLRGTSALLELPYFDLVSSCAHDILHRLSIGIIKTTLEVTFGRPTGVREGTQRPQTLRLPDWLRNLVSEHITIAAKQLASEHHASLKDPYLHWKWYTGVVSLSLFCSPLFHPSLSFSLEFISTRRSARTTCIAHPRCNRRAHGTGDRHLLQCACYGRRAEQLRPGWALCSSAQRDGHVVFSACAFCCGLSHREQSCAPR